MSDTVHLQNSKVVRNNDNVVSASATVTYRTQGTQFTIPQSEIATARRAVSTYLQDLGLHDPDVVANASRKIVEHALRSKGVSERGKSLHDEAIRATVDLWERWLDMLSVASKPKKADHEDRGRECEALRCCASLAVKVPAYLGQNPKAFGKREIAPNPRNRPHPAGKAVVPPQTSRRMTQQNLGLLPAAWCVWTQQLQMLLRSR